MDSLFGMLSLAAGKAVAKMVKNINTLTLDDWLSNVYGIYMYNVYI